MKSSHRYCVRFDPELRARLGAHRLAEDPNFIFDREAALWSLHKRFGLRVLLEDERFTVVDVENTADRAGPAPSKRGLRAPRSKAHCSRRSSSANKPPFTLMLKSVAPAFLSA